MLAFPFQSTDVQQTVSAVYSFFLAMTLFPEAQKKAQAEIDAVVGSDRLPTFTDRDSLPYVEALAKEVVRWNVVVPLGRLHKRSSYPRVDIFFQGYHTALVQTMFTMVTTYPKGL